MSLIISLFGVILFISSLLLLLSAVLTFPLYRNTREEIFLHMILALGLFASTLFIMSIFALFFPELTSEMFLEIEARRLPAVAKIISIFMLVTMIEFTFFYLHLSTNRIHLIEKYLPLIPTMFLGCIVTSLIVTDEVLDIFLYYGSYGIAIIIEVIVIILLIRLQNVRKEFAEQRHERELLTHLMTMLLGYFIFQAGDFIGLFGIIFSLDLVLLSMIAQVGLLPFVGFLLLLQSRFIWSIIDKINYPLLLNELN